MERTLSQIGEDFINSHISEIQLTSAEETVFRGFIHESLYAFDVNCQSEDKDYDEYLNDMLKFVWKRHISTLVSQTEHS